MRRARCFTASALHPGQEIALEPVVSQHLVQVLRLRIGEELILFNGDGHDYRATLLTASRKGSRVRVTTTGPVEPLPPLAITLGIGIAKGERMDWAVQKAVELGVTTISPLFTERCVVRLQGPRLDKRLAHWRGILVAACEQSRRRRLPTLEAAMPLAEWLTASPGPGLVLDPGAELSLPALQPPAAGRLRLLVGPEGGLTGLERDAAAGAGFRAVRLGPRILRTETAPLAALAAIQVLWGDFA